MTPAEVNAIRARWAAVEAADALAPKLPLDANGHPDEAKIEAMGEEAFAEVMASFAEGANALEEACEHAESDVKALVGEVDRLRTGLRDLYTYAWGEGLPDVCQRVNDLLGKEADGGK